MLPTRSRQPVTSPTAPRAPATTPSPPRTRPTTHSTLALLATTVALLGATTLTGCRLGTSHPAPSTAVRFAPAAPHVTAPHVAATDVTSPPEPALPLPPSSVASSPAPSSSPAATTSPTSTSASTTRTAPPTPAPFVAFDAPLPSPRLRLATVPTAAALSSTWLLAQVDTAEDTTEDPTDDTPATTDDDASSAESAPSTSPSARDLDDQTDPIDRAEADAETADSPAEKRAIARRLTSELESARLGTTYARTSLGFLADPTAFQWTAGAGYFVTEGLSVGGLFQLGSADNPLFVAPSLHVEYMFDLPSSETVRIARLKPFIQGGIGFAYISKERPNIDDIGFLMNVGFGCEYYLRDNVSVGSDFLFNILPEDTAGENFVFSWQVLALRFHF